MIIYKKNPRAVPGPFKNRPLPAARWKFFRGPNVVHQMAMFALFNAGKLQKKTRLPLADGLFFKCSDIVTLGAGATIIALGNSLHEGNQFDRVERLG